MVDIDKVIKNSDIQDICHGQTGDCLTVAVALRNLFGGKIKLISEIPGEGFNHAVLEKEDNLYDSYGKRFLVDIFEMHIPKEIEVEDINKHVYHIECPEKEFPGAYNKQLGKKIESILEKNIEKKD